MRPHAACHLSIKTVSRADGRSAVAAAAYRAGASYFDERVGRWRSYRSKADVEHVELVGFVGEPEELWNLAEAAETRGNSRVAREWEVILPWELTLAAEKRLVRGFALWLRDRYKVALMTAIHHPDRPGLVGELLVDMGLEPEPPARAQGERRNKHVHILATTREWDPETRTLGAKTRALDDKLTGPEEVEACRREWQRRVNAELARAGFEQRVDMRSYARQAAAGDAPEGLVPQAKQGPRATAVSRRERRETGTDGTRAGQRREAVRAHNEELWTTWELRRALRREEMRKDGTSAEIAATRETERRSAAAAGTTARTMPAGRTVQAAGEGRPTPGATPQPGAAMARHEAAATSLREAPRPPENRRAAPPHAAAAAPLVGDPGGTAPAPAAPRPTSGGSSSPRIDGADRRPASAPQEAQPKRDATGKGPAVPIGADAEGQLGRPGERADPVPIIAVPPSAAPTAVVQPTGGAVTGGRARPAAPRRRSGFDEAVAWALSGEPPPTPRLPALSSAMVGPSEAAEQGLVGSFPQAPQDWNAEVDLEAPAEPVRRSKKGNSPASSPGGRDRRPYRGRERVRSRFDD